jgi:multiple sugar transport system permease protein
MPRMTSFKTNRYLAAYLFLLPTLLGLFVFRIGPLVNAVVASFYGTRVKNGVWTQDFVGFRNYVHLWLDHIFLNSLWVTLKFVAVSVALQTLGALLLAILLTRKKTGMSVFRSLYMVPIGLSVPMVSVMWQILLSPNKGLVNGLLSLVGVHSQPFFTSASQALGSIIFLSSWRSVVYWMLFLVAGIKEIPGSLYEAAEIDGAPVVQEVLKITIPLLKPIILFVAVVNTSSTFLLFGPMYIITSGGPNFSTDVLMYEAYTSAFKSNDMGRSMAITLILILVTLICVAIQFKTLQSSTES